MKISYIGKFSRLYDEEYVARSFEMLGHQVQRVSEGLLFDGITKNIEEFNPDFILFAKLYVAEPDRLLSWFKTKKFLTVSWTFDLYWDYQREALIKRIPGLKADYVFTTDGGHEERWKEAGIKHKCIRQGIYLPECKLFESDNPHGIVFVGWDNPFFKERKEMITKLKTDYEDFRWFGRQSTHELRGLDLNKIYSTAKIVVGDSVHSPYYWSNRVVETLGRGGFLIHREVPGLQEEYPHLVTYDGSYGDLRGKIDYYSFNEDERLAIIKNNYDWVKTNYTMDKKCSELIYEITHSTK